MPAAELRVSSAVYLVPRHLMNQRPKWFSRLLCEQQAEQPRGGLLRLGLHSGWDLEGWWGQVGPRPLTSV